MNDLAGGAGGVLVPVAPFARAELPRAQSDPAHFPDSVDVQIPHRPTVVVRGLELHNRPRARCDRADLHAALLGEPVVAGRRAIAHPPAHADGRGKLTDSKRAPTVSTTATANMKHT